MTYENFIPLMQLLIRRILYPVMLCFLRYSTPNNGVLEIWVKGHSMSLKMTNSIE